jgi:DNA-binding SARP family transcriptional activator/ABC-type transport system substrate-binding protein
MLPPGALTGLSRPSRHSVVTGLWLPEAMDVWILGPLEVHDRQRTVAVAGAKQRLLLALLIAERGRRVSRDLLTEALWPDRPPGDAVHALDVQISRLRKAIGPGRVVTQDGGYRLDLAGAALDVDRFMALVADAGNRPPSEAAPLLREALGLWRGPPFGELGQEELLRARALALEDRRVEALEALFEAELALGHDAAIMPELEALAAEDPLRERPHEQLMLALYRSGRQADSLRVYDDLRHRLSEELGIGPGESVRGLHEAILRQDRSLERPRMGPPGETPTAVGPRRVLLGRTLIGASVAAALSVVAVVLATGGSSKPAPDALLSVPVAEKRLAFIDLRRGRVLASLPIADALDEGNATLAQGRDADWLIGGNGELLQIDPRRRRVTRSIGLGFPPGGIALGLGSVWVVAKDRPILLRLDPVYGVVERKYRLPTAGVNRPDFFSDVEIAAGSVWVAQGEERVIRINPRSGRTLAGIRAPGAASLAGRGDSVWVAGGSRGVLYRIDPAENAVVTRVPLDPNVCCVAIGGGYVWAMNYRVWKLSSDGHVVSSVPIDGDGANLDWTGDEMWVSEGASGQETRIQPQDDSTRTLRTGGLALQTVVRGDVATVVVGEAPPDLLAGVSGPVARIELGFDWLQPDDPALSSPSAAPFWREQLLDATCARLLTLRSAPPPLGWRAVPEIADLPTSVDGRTWTFRVRPGFRFSPPSNAPVTAASMRHTIERALSPQMGLPAPAPTVLGDVVGLAAFRSGRARHIRGLRGRGDRLVIRLSAPAYDLAARMTSRAFCAVPNGTPPSATRFVETPIPSAGPYYLAAHYGGLAALLRRNPSYHGPRPRHFAAFLYEEAVQLPAGADRVARARADLVAGSGDALRPSSSVARLFGSRASGRGPRWSRRTLAATHLLRLRTRTGPLADARLRRVVALALDRRAMAALFDDEPTAHALPAGVAGSVAVPVPRPDPGRARALVGRRAVTLTFAGCRAGPACHSLGLLLRTSLRRVGITLQLRPAARHADVTFQRANMATPDPLGFLAAVGAPRPPFPRPGPARVAALASRRDELLTRNGNTFAFGTPTLGELASARLGCGAQLPLSFGDDLTALCPRGSGL